MYPAGNLICRRVRLQVICEAEAAAQLRSDQLLILRLGVRPFPSPATVPIISSVCPLPCTIKPIATMVEGSRLTRVAVGWGWAVSTGCCWRTRPGDHRTADCPGRWHRAAWKRHHFGPVATQDHVANSHMDDSRRALSILSSSSAIGFHRAAAHYSPAISIAPHPGPEPQESAGFPRQSGRLTYYPRRVRNGGTALWPPASSPLQVRKRDTAFPRGFHAVSLPKTAVSARGAAVHRRGRRCVVLRRSVREEDDRHLQHLRCTTATANYASTETTEGVSRFAVASVPIVVCRSA